MLNLCYAVAQWSHYCFVTETHRRFEPKSDQRENNSHLCATAYFTPVLCRPICMAVEFHS